MYKFPAIQKKATVRHKCAMCHEQISKGERYYKKTIKARLNIFGTLTPSFLSATYHEQCFNYLTKKGQL